MIRFWSPLSFRFNYCVRFTRSRYFFFIYKLFYNPYNLWILFTTSVLRKYLWVRFVKRNYVYYLRCLGPLKRAFCLYKRFFFLLQSAVYPLFHVLFCMISTMFSFLLNRLFWLFFYLRKIKSHFFFIRNLTFPTIIFINNRTNSLLKKLTLSSWSNSFLYNYFFSKSYKAFNFRFFMLQTLNNASVRTFDYIFFSIPHRRNLLYVPNFLNYSQFLNTFLCSFCYYCLLFWLEFYIIFCRLFIWVCNDLCIIVCSSSI